ncbi:DUF6973 domain-containing protein [Nocardia tenerifensis]|nr:hypothetical protein [Nocardia tenerifensis]
MKTTRLGISVIFCAAAFLCSLGAAQAYPGQGTTQSERDYCMANAGDCLAADDAKNWATGVAEWRYQNNPRSLHNGVGDAFRHCIWAGAIAQRIGADRAATILSIHENKDDNPLDEWLMDTANNETGVRLGVESNSKGGGDTWGWIMNRCGALADGGKLRTLR